MLVILVIQKDDKNKVLLMFLAAGSPATRAVSTHILAEIWFLS
jgi:hypothetical protein